MISGLLLFVMVLSITLPLSSCDLIMAGLKGEQGIQGEKGDKGEPGQNGTVITIGENGNWFLDGVDTGIKASCNCDGAEKNYTGIAFNDAYECPVEKAFSLRPMTYEAWIKLPQGYTQRAGVILGNYDDTPQKDGPFFSFEVYTNGSPRLYLKSAGASALNLVFQKINVCTGEWLHLAIVNDYANKNAYCYVNGELEQEINYSAMLTPNVTQANAAVETASPAMIGNDFRNGGKQSFKGMIHSIAVYSDIRTRAEISKDMYHCSYDSLIAAWDLSAIPESGKFVDLSGNDYNVLWPWVKKSPLTQDFAYSFVLVGDTQSVNAYDPDHFSTIYNWIIENKDSKKIAYVMGLGDITDGDTDAEWSRASAAFDALDKAGIAYSLVRGNHDSSAKFNSIFGKTPYAQSFDESFGGTIANSYRKIEVADIKYLIFTLDYGANDSILSWASEIIARHSNYNVIITTHAYLYRDGTTLDKNDVCPPTSSSATNNNGDDIWNELISKHDNIVLVCCGHDPDPHVVCQQTKGENGNVVTQILTDHQYVDRDLHKADMPTTGMVTVLHFSADGKTVFVECYSTVYDMYFKQKNQFEITLHVVQ